MLQFITTNKVFKRIAWSFLMGEVHLREFVNSISMVLSKSAKRINRQSQSADDTRESIGKIAQKHEK